MRDTINALIDKLHKREEVCWSTANFFIENKDAHGIHDMGVEIQALQRAIATLEELLKKCQ